MQYFRGKNLKRKYLAPLLALFLLGNTMGLSVEADQIDIPKSISKKQVQSTLFPVKVLQKTGNDAKRNVWVFLGDGYTASQQDKFIQDVTERIQKMLQMEPYKSYVDGMNIYAIRAPSKESGAERDANKDGTGGIMKDTFYQVQYNSFGLERLAWFNGKGEERLCFLKQDLEDHYLDSGGKVIQTIILSNSDTYFGGGAAFYAASSRAAGEAMVIHEASHGFANLADEYNGHPEDSPNKTKKKELSKVPWKEFFSFRGVTLYKYGEGAQKPVEWDCIMNSLYRQHGYCEVCKEHVAEVLNRNLKEDKHPYYMAEPNLTIKEDNLMVTGKTIASETIEEANGYVLQYRTVIKNFTSKKQIFTLSLRILDEKGYLKYEKKENFSIPKGALKSIAIETSILQGLKKGDTIQTEAKNGV